MLGRSTFGLSMWLLKWLPVHVVDRILLCIARAILGDTARLGLKRPASGPLELKSLSGKTPVLDVGTFAKIKSGDIKVCISRHRSTIVRWNPSINLCLDLVLTYFFPIDWTVQVRPDIRQISGRDVEFADGQLESFDAIVLATGYKSNVPFWLKVPNCFQWRFRSLLWRMLHWSSTFFPHVKVQAKSDHEMEML